MAKKLSKRAFLSVEFLENRELLSGASASLLATPLVAPSSVTSSMPLSTPTVVSSTSPVQVIVPPVVLTTPVNSSSSPVTSGTTTPTVPTSTSPVQVIVPPVIVTLPIIVLGPVTAPVIVSPPITVLPPITPPVIVTPPITVLPPSTSVTPSNPSVPVIDGVYLLVPGTNTPIQIIVPPAPLPKEIDGITLGPSDDITLLFNTPTGPVKVETIDLTPQGLATFLDYVESGAFDNSLFARLAVCASSSSPMTEVEAMVGTNGSLSLVGGSVTGFTGFVTLSPTTLKIPSTLTFQFDTSLGTADVQLNGAKTPLTVASFMNYIESGAFDAALFQRLQTGSSLPTSLQASMKNGCIILSGGITGSRETILLPDGTTVNVPPTTQPAGTNPDFYFNISSGSNSGSVELTIFGAPTAKTEDKFINYLESNAFLSSDLIEQIYSSAGQPTVSTAVVALSKSTSLSVEIQGLPTSGQTGTTGSNGPSTVNGPTSGASGTGSSYEQTLAPVVDKKKGTTTTTTLVHNGQNDTNSNITTVVNDENGTTTTTTTTQKAGDPHNEITVTVTVTYGDDSMATVVVHWTWNGKKWVHDKPKLTGSSPNSDGKPGQAAENPPKVSETPPTPPQAPTPPVQP